MCMNININTSIQFVLKLAKIFVVILLINTMLYLYLPNQTVELIKSNVESLPFSQVNLQKVFVSIQKPKNNTVQKVQDEEIVKSFMLQAIYAYKDNSGFIVISHKSKPNESSMISQKQTFHGYVLERLYGQKVVFSKGGAEYELHFSNDTNLKTIVVPTPSSQNGSPVKVSKVYINQYAKDFDSIWKSIAIKEVLDSKGAIDGFKILSITKNSPFDKLGLKVNDVIKKVNNTVLKSYADAFNIYNNIGKISNLQITVIRENKEVEINYEID